MNAEVVNLSSFDDDDEGYTNFLEDLKKDVTNAVFMIEKSDGSIRIGCTYEDRRDLVFAIWKLHTLGLSVATGEHE